jgi:hypothetical protein
MRRWGDHHDEQTALAIALAAVLVVIASALVAAIVLLLEEVPVNADTTQ